LGRSSSGFVGSGLFSLAAVFSTVPPVLDGVIATVLQFPCDSSPLLSHGDDQVLDQSTFFGRDGLVVKLWVEILMPALATLFRSSADKNISDCDPFAGTFLFY
jgi:hypothetical protein